MSLFEEKTLLQLPLSFVPDFFLQTIEDEVDKIPESDRKARLKAEMVYKVSDEVLKELMRYMRKEKLVFAREPITEAELEAHGAATS